MAPGGGNRWDDWSVAGTALWFAKTLGYGTFAFNTIGTFARDFSIFNWWFSSTMVSTARGSLTDVVSGLERAYNQTVASAAAVLITALKGTEETPSHPVVWWLTVGLVATWLIREIGVICVRWRHGYESTVNESSSESRPVSAEAQKERFQLLWDLGAKPDLDSYLSGLSEARIKDIMKKLVPGVNVGNSRRASLTARIKTAVNNEYSGLKALVEAQTPNGRTLADEMEELSHLANLITQQQQQFFDWREQLQRQAQPEPTRARRAAPRSSSQTAANPVEPPAPTRARRAAPRSSSQTAANPVDPPAHERETSSDEEEDDVKPTSLLPPLSTASPAPPPAGSVENTPNSKRKPGRPKSSSATKKKSVVVAPANDADTATDDE